MIEVRNISKSFNGKTVLDDISFKADKNEIVTILGKNGSGKSVLLKIAAALMPPDSGEVIIENEKVDDQIYFRGDGRVPVGYVFQKGGLFDSMNLYENIAFPLRRRGVSDERVDETVRKNLARVGLAGNELRLPSELSGGMQKRAGLARVLSINPSSILYDDPTAGLDPVLTDSIADLILEIRKSEGVTTLIVTHDMKFAHKVSDRILLIVSSKAVFWGSKDEFFSQSSPYSKQFINGDSEGPIEFL